MTLAGQDHAHSRAVAGTGLDLDPAAMRFDDARDNRQTQAGAFGFRRAQYGTKGAPPLLFIHAWAGVLEVKRNVPGSGAARAAGGGR